MELQISLLQLFGASVLTQICSSKFLPKLISNKTLAIKHAKISDHLLLDSSEFLNSIYEDMTSINELISLK